MRLVWLSVFLAGCVAQPTEISERLLYGIAQRISTEILLDLTRPQHPEYEFGLVNEPGGTGMIIPAKESDASVILFGHLLWAHVVDELSARGAEEGQLRLSVPRLEVQVESCVGLGEKLGDLRSAVFASLRYFGAAADTEDLETITLDGPSYLIQAPLQYGDVYLKPASWANERLHRASSDALVRASECAADKVAKEVDYYY